MNRIRLIDFHEVSPVRSQSVYHGEAQQDPALPVSHVGLRNHLAVHDGDHALDGMAALP